MVIAAAHCDSIAGGAEIIDALEHTTARPEGCGGVAPKIEIKIDIAARSYESLRRGVCKRNVNVFKSRHQSVGDRGATNFRHFGRIDSYFFF